MLGQARQQHQIPDDQEGVKAITTQCATHHTHNYQIVSQHGLNLVTPSSGEQHEKILPDTNTNKMIYAYIHSCLKILYILIDLAFVQCIFIYACWRHVGLVLIFCIDR